MSSHVDLPQDIWKLVLQHVPLTQRLSSCALVCQKFKAAAVAATEHIEATLSEQPAVDHFATYLQQHGRHLTSLMLTGEGIDDDAWPKLEQLPCQRLQELHFVSLDFGWGPNEDRPSVFDDATAITRLEIQDANLYLPALSVLPSLKHLCLVGSTSRFDSKDGKSKASAFAFSSVQQLTYLGLSSLWLQQPTRLGLSGQNLDGDLSHISSLTGLHALHIICCPDLTAAAPGLSLPPSLQHLKLCDPFDPSLLAAATQLTYLDLGGAVVQDDDVSGGVCLLVVLSKLQHLDYFNLVSIDANWPPPSPAYQALVASSSKLRVLQMDCRLPEGAFAHIFPSAAAHAVLPRLEELGVSCIPPGAVAGVVRCCPALQHLTLAAEAPGCTHLAALSRLSALTRLELFFDHESGGAGAAASIQSLAGLTSLQELFVPLRKGFLGGGIMRRDLLPLTALQQLTKLVGGDSYYHLDTQAGQPPDVWLQLLEDCGADRACLRSIIQSYAQQQQDVTNLQQDNARLQQQVVDLQQQLAGQQQGQAQQQQHA